MFSARMMVLFMMMVLAAALAAVETHGAVVLVEPYGENAFRVRVAPPGGATSDDTITALLPVAVEPALQAQGEDQAAAALATQTNGNLKVETIDGQRVFSRVSDGKLLVTESSVVFGAPMASHALPQLNVSWSVGSAELYGLGQHRQACYESGGFQTPPLLRTFTPGDTVQVDLARGEGGASNTLPWLTGGAEFGFWLNNPAMGHVVFDATDDANRTMAWQLGAAVQLDYLITTPSAEALASGTGAFSLIEDFTAWVGRSPGLPEWALGYWHCKNRYASQAELLAAAHGFANRSIPVDVIIIGTCAH
jgi:alpha-D-xyloside xylohydrolase